MNKKILLLILLIPIFSLTGCDAKYEMEIKDSKITENISFSVPNTYSNQQINKLVDYYGMNSDSGFKEKITDDGNNKTVSLTGHVVKIDTYFDNSDSFINKCYNSVNFTLDGGKYYIGTSKGFKCLTYDYMEIKNFTISIETYHKVYDNNADKVKNNVYIWNININNIKKNSILFIVSKSDYVWYYKYRYLFGGLAAVGITLFTIYLVISIFKMSSKHANKI